MRYTTLSDSELLNLLKKGDRTAYTVIYQRYKVLLYRFAYKKTDNKEEANDLTQELFLMIWEQHAEIVVQSELAAFLFSILKHKIFDHYKHKKVTDRYIDSFLSYLEFNANATTDHLVRHNELSALIESEIAALPLKMRQIFELSRKTNLSRKQIAAELNVSEQTVKSHMQHALKILKTRLGSLLFLIVFIHP